MPQHAAAQQNACGDRVSIQLARHSLRKVTRLQCPCRMIGPEGPPAAQRACMAGPRPAPQAIAMIRAAAR